ncbi:hypothetical protein CH306_05550 [Rhodococcus sp. 15-725-2-2b]|nr:hypothetical protein CH277_24685 [Rhodococcus sp. 06-469-3-2]OZC67743.1 hypothetical protein CH276_04815 [Rhodococcus sp. 06-470-2]OZD49974.1 hypothetical protein CH264_02900 [Rhodococcus sp. 06-1477-1A]OZE62260.1 hypothetical protein CH265_12440 [Rhodococcus sp. 05-2221-1B]OZE76414.1 hypothetical protein CH306_05550 [Rhodococcus sp. 15-725-2-2b]
MSSSARLCRFWLIGFVVVLTASCSSFEPGERRSMDEEEVSRALRGIAFDVPSGFEFVQGFTHTEFVGQPAWRARFDAPNEAGDETAVSAANPSYPPLQPVACAAASTSNWTALGLTCEPEMLSTSRPDQQTADRVTVLLTRNTRQSSLFIYSQGH